MDITGRRTKVRDLLPPLSSLHLSIVTTSIAFPFSPSTMFWVRGLWRQTILREAYGVLQVVNSVHKKKVKVKVQVTQIYFACHCRVNLVTSFKMIEVNLRPGL